MIALARVEAVLTVSAQDILAYHVHHRLYIVCYPPLANTVSTRYYDK
jgi:hypothetical protein